MTIVIAFQGSGYRTYPSERLRLRGVLHPLRPAGLATRVPLFGELQPLRRPDAVVFDIAVLLSLHPHGGNDRYCLH